MRRASPLPMRARKRAVAACRFLTRSESAKRQSILAHICTAHVCTAHAVWRSTSPTGSGNAGASRARSRLRSKSARSGRSSGVSLNRSGLRGWTSTLTNKDESPLSLGAAACSAPASTRSDAAVPIPGSKEATGLRASSAVIPAIFITRLFRTPRPAATPGCSRPRSGDTSRRRCAV